MPLFHCRILSFTCRVFSSLFPLIFFSFFFYPSSLQLATTTTFVEFSLSVSKLISLKPRTHARHHTYTQNLLPLFLSLIRHYPFKPLPPGPTSHSHKTSKTFSRNYLDTKQVKRTSNEPPFIYSPRRSLHGSPRSSLLLRFLI